MKYRSRTIYKSSAGGMCSCPCHCLLCRRPSFVFRVHFYIRSVTSDRDSAIQYRYQYQPHTSVAGLKSSLRQTTMEVTLYLLSLCDLMKTSHFSLGIVSRLHTQKSTFNIEAASLPQRCQIRDSCLCTIGVTRAHKAQACCIPET